MLIVNIQKLNKILTFKQLVYNNTICLFSLGTLKIKLKNRQNVYKFVLLKITYSKNGTLIGKCCLIIYSHNFTPSIFCQSKIITIPIKT